MPSAEQDLAFLNAGTEQLEEYLLSDELYWPLTGSSALPRLTIGGLLLAQRRLRARKLTGPDIAQLTALEERLAEVRSKRRSAWEAKCRREVRARLDLWKNFLADYRQSPDTLAQEYPRQAQWRVLLTLLLDELFTPPPEARILEEFDTMLQAFWLPGAFVWEAELADEFPQTRFWFLYGRLKS